MKNEAFYLVIGICGFMYGILSYTYSNLEYKGYSRAQTCTGDCYVKYVEENGSVVDQLMAKREEAALDPYSSIRGLWAGCAACHGSEGQGMGVFPRLSGQTADYIQERLVSYKNRETIGNMSSTMWAQASMLSDGDIDTISKFIEETMK